MISQRYNSDTTINLAKCLYDILGAKKKDLPLDEYMSEAKEIERLVNLNPNNLEHGNLSKVVAEVLSKYLEHEYKSNDILQYEKRLRSLMKVK